MISNLQLKKLIPTRLTPSASVALIAGLLTGCTGTLNSLEHNRSNSPVQIYMAPNKLAEVKQTLLLPPLGVKNTALRKGLQQQLFSGARRHFTHPLQLVSPESAYANYITEQNLINSDGTLNVSEIVMIGQLMNASHIICPQFQQIRPYHPQKIALSITVVETESGQVSVELSAIFDATERDVREWFSTYSKQHRTNSETKEDLLLKLRSPAAFQAFVSDKCFTMLGERLPF